ncbi:MAG: thiamine pyrophosphate-binding protein [Candidatus Anammoxibacter sp.]
MKCTDYIVRFLEENGIKCMFVFQGGAIAHLIDSVYNNYQNGGVIKPLPVLHEQAGSMALDGYARVTGEIGTMAVTSGPGATNLLTGIACSYYDSIPGIYFCGQVRTWECKGESKQRQVGFQETDIVSMATPITKYAVLVENPENVRYELEKAIWLAKSGRPGPILIDLPMDVQSADIDPDKLKSYKPVKENKPNIEKDIKVVVEWIKKSKKPIIICGGGVRNANALSALKELATKTKIPVTVTFGGKDSYQHDNYLFSGVIGAMGNAAANESIGKSDLVLAIGTRFAWRQIKSKPKEFAPNAKIVHVEIDKEEINQRVKADIGIVSDAKEFLSQLLKELKSDDSLNFEKWAEVTRNGYKDNPFCKPEYYKEENGVHPYVFFKTLSEQMGDNDILVADAGQNVMWAMQTVEVRANQRVFTAHAHSPMGYSVPAAMGVAAFAEINESSRVIATIGDGAFSLNIQELQTIYANDLPVKIFIINNNAYGAIIDFQDANLGGRHYATTPEYGCTCPDVLAIVKAYKLEVDEIVSHYELADKIKSVLNTKGPIVCNVKLIPNTFVTLDP